MLGLLLDHRGFLGFSAVRQRAPQTRISDLITRAQKRIRIRICRLYGIVRHCETDGVEPGVKRHTCFWYTEEEARKSSINTPLFWLAVHAWEATGKSGTLLEGLRTAIFAGEPDSSPEI